MMKRQVEFITPIPKPKKRKGGAEQASLIFDEGKGLSTREQQYAHTAIINGVRQEVDKWRRIPNSNDWRVTPENLRSAGKCTQMVSGHGEAGHVHGQHGAVCGDQDDAGGDRLDAPDHALPFLRRPGLVHAPPHDGGAGRLRVREALSRRDADLPLDEVESRCEFSDGMFHLQSGVHFKKIEIFVFINQKFYGASCRIVNRTSC